ncbi:hypothetical protein [Nocardia sp. NPDC024068]|uniref:hypothetical protein n=1 Tax=Nocardia sp. NPDC024068 TaxID=3157197 RepID=UPI0033D00A71
MGIGEFFKDHWDDAVVGVASAAGFALGGPAGAALAGAAAGGLTALAQGEDPLEAAAFGAVGGLLGGVVGSVGRGGISAIWKTSAQGVKGLTTNGAKRAVPEAFAGVKLALGDSGKRMAWGMFSAGTSAMPFATDFAIREPVYQEMGYPDVPLIDISEEELSEIPKGMRHVMMPNPEELPYGLEFGPAMQTHYRTLPQTYLGIRKSFGDEASETTLPGKLKVGDISGEESSGIPQYAERVAGLREQFEGLRSMSDAVAKYADRTPELCSQGRGDVDVSIGALEKFAGIHPRDLEKIRACIGDYEDKTTKVGKNPIFELPKGADAAPMNEDSYTMLLVEVASMSAQSIMEDYIEQFELLAEEIAAKKPSTPDDADTGKDTKTGDREQDGTREDERGNGAPDPAYVPGGNTQYESPAADSTPNTAVSAPEPMDLTGDTESGVDPMSSNDSARVGDPASTTTPSPSTAASGDVRGAANSMAGQIAPVTATGGSGMQSALTSMLLPQLMRSMLNGDKAGPRDRDREGRDENHAAGASRAATTPGTASAQAAAPSPATPQQPVPQTATKAVSASSNAGPPPGGPVTAAGPARNPVYTFPDGRTQEVSPVVVPILDAALGNAAGTDARAAYADTSLQWSDPLKIGRRVPPEEAMTGDVWVWRDRTAVLVKFEDSAPEVVANGTLHTVTALDEMRDNSGEFGAFVGIFHPPGIERAETGPGAGAAPSTTGEAVLGTAVPA